MRSDCAQHDMLRDSSSIQDHFSIGFVPNLASAQKTPPQRGDSNEW